jgi:hypothetical protein
MKSRIFWDITVYRCYVPEERALLLKNVNTKDRGDAMIDRGEIDREKSRSMNLAQVSVQWLCY